MATWSATLWLEDLDQVDHDQLGSARLTSRYRGDQPRIQAWLSSVLGGLQSLEDMTWQVLTGIWPLTAIGVQLDLIGKIIRQERGELGDDAYRLFILGRIFVNRGDGQAPQFYELLDILGIPYPYQFYDYYPACFELTAAAVDYPEVVGDLVGDLKPAGVRLDWTYSEETDDDTFKTSDALYANTADTDGGFADFAETVGGYISGTTRY